MFPLIYCILLYPELIITSFFFISFSMNLLSMFFQMFQEIGHMVINHFFHLKNSKHFIGSTFLPSEIFLSYVSVLFQFGWFLSLHFQYAIVWGLIFVILLCWILFSWTSMSFYFLI